MTTALKRKLINGGAEDAGKRMTVLRALRLSVARASDDLFGLALGVIAIRQALILVDEATDLLSDDDLLLVLDCPNGISGVAALSGPLVAALVQQQTMGRVLDSAADPRGFTDTDAALSAPLIEGVLPRTLDLLEQETEQSCFQGIRFGARGEDVRSVVLGLRAKRYRQFTMSLDIALGQHQAQLTLLLPNPEEVEAPPPEDEETRAAKAAQSPMMEVETDLRAVLARFRLSLDELNALKVGDTLPLSRERLDDTALITVTNRVVARGRLGQMNGHRAVRLMAAPPLPKVAPSAAFQAQVTQHPDMPDIASAEDEASLSVLDGAGDGPMDDLASLTADEAADQITALAGLTAEELTPVDASDGLAPLDETALTAFAAAPIDIAEPEG